MAMGVTSPELHVLRTLEKIRSADLEQALLVLPFTKALILFEFMDEWVQNEWNIPLTCRLLTFLLKLYHRQLTSNRNTATTTIGNPSGSVGSGRSIRTLLDSIRTHLRLALQQQKSMIGFNLAGLKIARGAWEQEHVSEFVDWEKEMAARVKDIQLGNDGVASVSKKKRKRKALVASESI